MIAKRYYILLFITSFLFACNSHSEHWETLVQVESYLNEKPDSALSVLDHIDPSQLLGNEEKAKYALLKTIALDKNYIDTTTFDVLQPAIDYYTDHGTATNMLQTFYYQGRIFQNQGQDGKAMECFVKAIDKGEASDDVLTKARLLYTQGVLYSEIHEWDKSISAFEAAANYFAEKGKTDSYMNCITCIIKSFVIKGDKDKAENYVKLGQSCLEKCSPLMKGSFYSHYITYLQKFE
ncbi:MAG: hypothetical protein Q4B58_08080, partial [Bacteroidales bacterium]|nr:hypothetical protein [Bacteroidales bacterium]